MLGPLASRELAIGRFVTPRPESRRHFDTDQEVWLPLPLTGRKGTGVNSRHPLLHRTQGPTACVVSVGRGGNREARCSQPFDVLEFLLPPAVGKYVIQGIPRIGLKGPRILCKTSIH